jgi:hypothetical protein
MAQNLFAPTTQWGGALSGLIDSLYSPDASIKRDERQALIAKRNQDAAFKKAQIDKFAQDQQAKKDAKQAESENISNVVRSMFGGAPQGDSVMAYRSAGGVQPNTLPAVDDMGESVNQPPTIPMDRPSGYTPQAETKLNDVLGAIYASRALPGKTTYDQMEHGLQRKQERYTLDDVLAGARSPSDVAAATTAVAGKTPPFREGASGGSINVFTGKQDQSAPVPQARVAELGARTGKESALTGQANARTAQIRSETLPQLQMPAPGGGEGTVPVLGKDVSRETAKGAAAPGSALSDDAVEHAAHRYSIDGTLPPNLGRGQQGEATKVRILNRAAEISQANGDSGAAARIRQISGKAGSSALAQLTKQEQMVGAFEKNAISNADIALGASNAVDRTGVPVLNRWLLNGRKNILGDPDVSRFHAATNTFINEYAKIMSGSMGNTAVSDSLRKETEALLATKDTPEQFKATVDLMKQEMRNRMTGFSKQKDELTRSMSPTPAAAPGGAPAAAAPPKRSKAELPPVSAKGWKLFEDAKGNLAYVSPDGKQFEEPK